MTAVKPKATLYVRVPAEVHDALLAGAAEHGRKLSDHASRVLEHGLRLDEQAIHSLIAWCWRMHGYMEAVLVPDDANVRQFREALWRAEAGIGIRRPQIEG